MEELQIEIGTGARPDVRILRLTGPFTLSTMFDFQNIVREGAAAVTIVDLGGVPYMDSAALGALLGFHVSCQREHHRYALTGVSNRIRTLFQVAGVEGFLVRYETQEQAEAQLAAGAAGA
ncbi:MAG TPA: STAS domain-containing protein [Bryobacteraceae bacterium]|jgi:anti-anti-sigma factor